MNKKSVCSRFMQFIDVNSVSYVIIVAVFLLLSTAATGADARWPTRYQELKDEVDDFKILNAVQQSMYEYERVHKHHRRKREEKSVCYGELGCFEDSGPFGYLDMLPQSPEEIGTKFFFYSTRNRSDRPLLELPYLNMGRLWRTLSDIKTKNSTISDSVGADNITAELNRNALALDSFEGLDQMSVRVIVHGFGAACHHVWIYEMRTALMAVEDCIVICVDWEAGATLPNYVRAAANTRLVGKQLALLLTGLEEHKKLNLSRVHLIGFSLGAHVSGFAGSDLPGLRRITGLDPAGPLFEAQHTKARLDSSDANFVDVIHSNGENLILGGLGSWQPMGHVDFYPNGGRVQTGCSNIFVGAVTDFIWSPSAVIEGRSLCNHRRAYKFFIDSVASKCLFPAFPCKSYDDFLKGGCFPCEEGDYKDSRCGNMGYYADRSTGRGQLYLITREEEPFCAHQFHVEIHTSESDLPLRTIGKIEATLEGEHSLNETFSVTDKDDTELFAGDVISRILVPHPALGFPKSISLTYKTYSGWLSKGLPHWTVNKIIITDSYGKSFSMCKNYMLLESGTPVYIKLQPGICQHSDENDINFGAFKMNDQSNDQETTTISVTDDNGGSGDDVDKLREKKNVMNLGTNYKIAQNKTYAYSEQNRQLPWHPVLENGNSLDRSSMESSRSFPSDTPSEIFEPVLKDRQKQSNPEIGRSFDTNINEKANSFGEPEIVEPILKATTVRSRKMKNFPIDNNMSSKSRENSYFNVQLFPFRLSELFERAERYARETLLPLISEQAPRFFGFGAEREEPNDRKPKYIPIIDAINNETSNATTMVSQRRMDLPPILNRTVFIVDNPDDELNEFANENQTEAESDKVEPEQENIIPEKRSSKNILSLVRVREKRTTAAPLHKRQPKENSAARSFSSREYYTNPDDVIIDDNLKVVRIDLPTYKPPVTLNRRAYPPPLTSAQARRRHPFPYQYEIPSDIIPGIAEKMIKFK